LAALVTLAAMLGMAWTLRRQAGGLVRDSVDFLSALEIWSPLIAKRLKTPRDLKRFLNLLRYLASRLPGEAVSTIGEDADLVARVVLRRLLQVEQPGSFIQSALGLDTPLTSAIDKDLDAVARSCTRTHHEAFGTVVVDPLRLQTLAAAESEIDLR